MDPNGSVVELEAWDVPNENPRTGAVLPVVESADDVVFLGSKNVKEDC